MLRQYLQLLNPGGALLVVDSNQLRFSESASASTDSSAQGQVKGPGKGLGQGSTSATSTASATSTVSTSPRLSTFPIDDRFLFLHELLDVRIRADLDCATLDADGGLTVIYRRRNSQGPGLDFDTLYDTMVSSSSSTAAGGSTAATATANTEVAATNKNNRLGSGNHANNNNPNSHIISRYQALMYSSKSFQMSEELNRKILNLMRFEVTQQALNTI